MSFMTPFKLYGVVIVILFVVLGSYEEVTGKNTLFNKWVKNMLGHKDLH